MIGVVLAAGLGRRLGQGPKALFDLDGASMIERAAATLRMADVRHLVVVTGFDRDSVIDHCQTLGFDDVEFIHNDRYVELNNFHSVALACSLDVAEPLLIVNSDIVFLPEVVRAVTSADHYLVIVADRSTVDDEAMGVCVVGGRATAIGKHLPSTECVGEFIGVSVLRPAARKRYLEHATAALGAGCTDLYYEDIYARMAAEGPLGVALVDEEAWAEIDTPTDVPRALLVARRASNRAHA